MIKVNKISKIKTSIFTTMIFLASFAIASSAEKPAPGNELYTPTRIEWAALELQALHGKNIMTHESPLTITFIHQPDGYTVLCLMQYSADVQAAVLKIERDAIKYVVDKYRETPGFSWLRLEFKENPMKERWPGN
jgi:hypothetical protein